MFNQLTATETVAAMGCTARDAARKGELGEFGRGQLMSAYSASRHLSVELSSFEPELHAYTVAVAAVAPAAGLDGCSDAGRAGDLTCALLDTLRGHDSPAAVELRGAIHTALRELVDREVALLAEAIEEPRTR